MDLINENINKIDLSNHQDYEDIDWLFEENDECICNSCEVSTVPLKPEKRKRGRPSYASLHPELVGCVQNFIEQNSSGAHLRRRTSTMYSNGVTLSDIRNHVKTALHLEVSDDTIHRLMEPPNYNDHDFPNANCKLVPAGYEVLSFKVKRSRSLSPVKKPFQIVGRRSYSADSCVVIPKKRLMSDKVGRPKVKWPRSGSLNMQVHSCRSVETTNIMHTSFLKKMIKREMRTKQVMNVVLIADGGPDWSVKGVGNLMSLGMLWKELQLDTLTVQCYAPGMSRFNPIERLWSFLNAKIVTVTLPDDLAGEKPIGVC